MSYLTRMMRQTATWWNFNNVTDQFGDPSFDSPVVLQHASGTGVRWEDKIVKFINKRGEEDQGRATVFSATTEFDVGDYLFLGSSTATNPESGSGDMVRFAEKVVDIAAKKTLFKCIL